MAFQPLLNVQPVVLANPQCVVPWPFPAPMAAAPFAHNVSMNVSLTSTSSATTPATSPGLPPSCYVEHPIPLQLHAGFQTSVFQGPAAPQHAVPSLLHTVPSAAPEVHTTQDVKPAAQRRAHFDLHMLRGNRNIYVGGLPEGFLDKHLRDLVAPFGTVASARVMLHIHTGVSRGHGFVKFTSQEAAAAAVLALHDTAAPMTNGLCSRLTVRFADVKSDTSVVEAEPPSNRLFVRNIPLEVTQQDVREVFGAHGTVLQCALHLDSAAFKNGGTGVRTRIGYISFATVQEAEAAADALHGTKPFAATGPQPALMVKPAESEKKRALRRQHRRGHRSTELSHELTLSHSSGDIAAPSCAA